MSHVVVLGAGIVGTAAAWDLERRGHDVLLTDTSDDALTRATGNTGATVRRLDAADATALRAALADADLVVSAIPYAFGMSIATAAVDTGTHHLDFGGNPSVVAKQLRLDAAATKAGVAVVPDCGLAPGMANVLAEGAIRAMGEGPIDEVRLRVGALPIEPEGTLGYQLAFNPAGLVNEYAEPCEILHAGEYATVEPLTGFEEVAWDRWGPLEAFHTAGGSSSLPRRWAGTVTELDYKTLRYPGHGRIFRAMLEVGLFSEDPQPTSGIAPRTVLLEALREHLPTGDDDLVLVRVWASARRDGEVVQHGYQVEDRHDGTFSALARTTAFPATALAHLLLTGEVTTRGAHTMDGAIDAHLLIRELSSTSIQVQVRP